MSQLLALASAVLYGVADFAAGYASRLMPVWRVASWSQFLGLATLAVGLLIVPTAEVTATDLAFGAIGGVAGLIGLVILYATLAAGTMSVVAPITGAAAAAIPVLYDLMSGVRLSRMEWLGVGLAIAAVLLVGFDREARHISPKLLGQALGAGFAFALFFIALGQTSPESGLWPLVAARSVSIPIAFGVAYARGVAAPPTDRSLRWVAAIGTTDMAANVSITLALQRGPIGINSVLSSLYPAVTALAAVIVLHERPTPRQGVGIALALAAVLALAL
jgi:drug/metabolite transporter (DMT)-like permease